MANEREQEENSERPSVRVVREFHTNSDVDANQDSLHHTIGPGVNQAASGGHNHDGANSSLLLEGYTIAGSRTGGSALVSVIGALQRLGASDETTA